MLKGEFLEKVKYIHGDKYDYILNNDFKISDYIRIICPVHGEFKQRCYAHLRGQNCPKCINNKKLTTEEWINKAKSIHGDKYDYSKVNYVNKRTPIIIISKEFGEFEQLPNVHLKGSGLPKQINNINGIIDYDIEKTLKFIEKAKKIHGYRYDYSKVEYVNCKTKVCIICPIH